VLLFILALPTLHPVREEREVAEKGRERRARSLGVVLILLFVLAVQEVVLRAAFPVPEVTNYNRIAYSALLNSTLRSQTFLIHAAFTWTSEPDGVTFVHHLNQYGFRDSDWSIRKPPGTTRVLLVGDSFVEGFMASDDETIAVGFERACQDAGTPAEAMNLGVGGTGLDSYVALIRDAIPVLHPDAIILVLYANDLPGLPYDPAWIGEPIEPAFARPWTPRVVEVLRRLWRHQPVGSRWSSAPFPFFAPVPDPSNPWTLRGSELEKVVDPAIADAMKRGTFNPFVVNQLQDLEQQLRQPANPRPYLAALGDYAAARGVGLHVAYLPYASQVSDHYLPFHRHYSPRPDIVSLQGDAYQVHAASVRRTCEDLDIPFLDLTPILRREEQSGHRLYWNYDEHMRGEGYLLVGEVLARWWRSLPAPPSPCH
jgi:hypothetical protein